MKDLHINHLTHQTETATATTSTVTTDVQNDVSTKPMVKITKSGEQEWSRHLGKGSRKKKI